MGKFAHLSDYSKVVRRLRISLKASPDHESFGIFECGCPNREREGQACLLSEPLPLPHWRLPPPCKIRIFSITFSCCSVIRGRVSSS